VSLPTASAYRVAGAPSENGRTPIRSAVGASAGGGVYALLYEGDHVEYGAGDEHRLLVVHVVAAVGVGDEHGTFPAHTGDVFPDPCLCLTCR
jgi:hypothetical protein